MTECLIIGAGPSKSLLEGYIPDIFTICPNLHYPTANILVAIDEPIVKDIIKNYQQPLFTTLYWKERYLLHPRVFSIEPKDYFGTGSYSSGLRAVALATLFNFSKIYLSGFDFYKKNTEKYIKEFRQIKQSNIKYIKIDFETAEEQPWFDKLISLEEFKNEFRKIKRGNCS